MKKSIAGGIAALLVAGGILATGSAASAHTPEVTATCESIDISAVYYDGHRDAQGEPTIEAPNPAYVPAHPGSPAVGEPTIEAPNPDYVPAQDAVYETIVTEREYRQLHLLGGYEYRWFPADVTPEGWEATGEVRTEEREVSPAQPAQGEPTIVIPNPDYIPAVPATEEQGEPTIEIPNPDYIPESSEPNSVSATVDGVQVLSETFSTSYSNSISLTKHLAHEYSVTITAWNDPTGERGWTKTYTGTTEACIAPKPEDKVTVGEWSEPEITCDAEVGDEIAITRTITTTPAVLVDGLWVDGTPVTTTEEGTYTVTAEDIEALECEVPPTEPPTEEPPTEQPPVDQPPAETPPAAAANTLAQTGGESALGLALGALTLLLAGAALLRRRARA